MKNNLKLTILFAGIVFSALFLSENKQRAQTKQVETAGQKFKNIKVLNEMPADQMGKVMNIMSASLGVNCSFCHVENDFARDDKEKKQEAREMIKMTFELNKNHFDNRPEITCNTCHRGEEHPQSALNLNLIAVEERPKQPETKPTVEWILEKYGQALGGKANLAKIKSRWIKASRVEPNGKTEPEEIWQKSPNKLLVKTVYPAAVVTESFDGANVWKRVNETPIDLKTDEIEEIRRNAELFGSANLKDFYSKLEFSAVDKIDGREVNLIRATTATGGRERLYFDRETGLLVRRTASVPTVLGNFVYQVDYSDYKDFGGVKLPATTRFAVPNITWTRKILEVKNNAAIEDARFNQPAK
ncbi:MAG: c-type cytochrome [Acidobacteriota bacterium]|nr:c-type cytochrome [Acidobacteriota bacterium]